MSNTPPASSGTPPSLADQSVEVPLGRSPLASDSSPSAEPTGKISKPAMKAELSQLVEGWIDLAKTDRPGAAKLVKVFFEDPSKDCYVKLLSSIQVTNIMYNVLHSSFEGGHSTIPSRVQDIRMTLRQWQQDGGLLPSEDEEGDDQKRDSPSDLEDEEVQLQVSQGNHSLPNLPVSQLSLQAPLVSSGVGIVHRGVPPSAPPPLPPATTAVPNAPRRSRLTPFHSPERVPSSRKAATTARKKIREDANDHNDAVLRQFSTFNFAPHPASAQESRRNARNSNREDDKKGRKGTGTRRSSSKKRRKDDDGDDSSSSSSDSDSSSSSSDSDSSSHSSSSSSASVSDSSDSDSPISSDDDDDNERRKKKRTKTESTKKGLSRSARRKLRKAKKKRGYKYAEQIWKLCRGRVHHYLMQFQWKHTRSQYEIDLCSRIFDYRMNHGASFADKDIRLLACRIFVLQSHDLTGNWNTAAQFQERPLGYVVVDEKQLSRAAKSAKQIQEMAPKKPPKTYNETRHNFNNNSHLDGGGGGGYRPDNGHNSRRQNNNNRYGHQDRRQNSSQNQDNNNRHNNGNNNNNQSSDQNQQRGQAVKPEAQPQR